MDLEDEDVDVLTIEAAKDEFEGESFGMPVLLDVGDSESEEEIVAIGPGTMRRRSPGAGQGWMNGQENGNPGAEKKRLNGTSKVQQRARKR